MISGSTGPVFTKFSLRGKCLIVDCRFHPIFRKAQGTLPWQPISGSKFVKSDYLSLFVTLEFRNRLQYRNSDIKKTFICDDLATSCVNLVYFGPLSPVFKIGKTVHPVVSFLKINLSDKLSKDMLGRFSPSFHHMVNI